MLKKEPEAIEYRKLPGARTAKQALCFKTEYGLLGFEE
jgi:hypothetical protein